MKMGLIKFFQGCMQKGMFVTISFLVMGLSSFPALAVDISSSTVYFNSTVNVQNGDISDFFSGVVPLPGVCEGDDVNGINESPGDEAASLDGAKHPSGFNMRRVLTAYNPIVGRGTLYIGIDLPGGTGSPSNLTSTNTVNGVQLPQQVLPFDADGDGSSDTIGVSTTGPLGVPLFRCPVPITTEILNVWKCWGGSQGGDDNQRSVSGAPPGGRENYVITIGFGNPPMQILTAEYYQASGTPAGEATLEVSPNTYAVEVSTIGAIGGIQAYDVIFAITGLEDAIPNRAARLRQSISVNSASNRDGASQGEDQIQLTCNYNIPDNMSLDRSRILRFKTSVKDATGKYESSSETIYYREGNTYHKVSDKVKK